MVLGLVAIGMALGLSGTGVAPRASAQMGPAACTTRSLPPYGGGDNNFTDAPGYSTTIDMGGGADDAEMADCNDWVYGGTGSDDLHGAHGDDHVYGQGGNDKPTGCGDTRCGKLFGGAGNDTVEGGPGSDDLDDSQTGADVDALYGQDADDVVNGADGDTQDTINGGAGTDTCYRDPGETPSSCEN